MTHNTPKSLNESEKTDTGKSNDNYDYTNLYDPEHLDDKGLAKDIISFR